jgi:hypothetical protein
MRIEPASTKSNLRRGCKRACHQLSLISEKCVRAKCEELADALTLDLHRSGFESPFGSSIRDRER